MSQKKFREKETYDHRNYECMEGAVVLKKDVWALPYCPSGKCWMTHLRGVKEKVRLKRTWNEEWGHYQLECRRCEKVWKRWL